MRTKQNQVTTLGEGVTHLIVNEQNTDDLLIKELEGYLHYLDNFVCKLRQNVNDRKWGEYRW